MGLEINIHMGTVSTKGVHVKTFVGMVSTRSSDLEMIRVR